MQNLPFHQSAFLLRVWRSNSEWRISLEDPMTGERNGFSKLEAFMEFLKNDMDSPPRPEEEDAATSDSDSQP